MEKFKHECTEIQNPSLKLALLNAEKYPNLAAQLQIMDFPSLMIVTEGNKIRPWPFASRFLTKEAIEFMSKGQWDRLPVYERMLKTAPTLTGWQFKVFTLFGRINVSPQACRLFLN